MFTKKLTVCSVVFLGAIFYAGTICSAQPPKIVAQKLVDETVAQHPEISTMIMHVTPPGKTDNIAIACVNPQPGCLGEKSSADDVSSMVDDLDIVKRKNSALMGVVLPLKDRTGKAIGALGVVFPYQEGDKDYEFLSRAEDIRNDLQAKIPTLESLFKPAH